MAAGAGGAHQRQQEMVEGKVDVDDKEDFNACLLSDMGLYSFFFAYAESGLAAWRLAVHAWFFQCDIKGVDGRPSPTMTMRGGLSQPSRPLRAKIRDGQIWNGRMDQPILLIAHFTCWGPSA